MKKKSVYFLIELFAFIALIGGVSYAYFVYNKNVADVASDTGDISIDISNVSGTISANNILPMTDEEGMKSTYYVNFNVNATVDTDPIYYEVYILPKSGSTLDTAYLKTYLTNQNNQKISNITIYNSLSNAEKTGGKVLYKGLVTINDDGSVKNYTKNFRLRLWLDENYPVLTAKSFNFDIFLYSYNIQNVDSSNISYGNNQDCDTVECQLETMVGVY